MPVLINDFKSGWQNTVQHEDMNTDALFMCKDSNIDELGALTCRKLHKKNIYFTTQSLESEIENFYQIDVEGIGKYLIFYTVGSSLYCWNSATNGTRTLSSAMTGGHVSYAPLKPVLSSKTFVFITDGTTMLADDGTTTKTWGIDAPSGSVSATAQGSGGSLSAGDYSYVFTFYDGETGSESDPSAACATFTAAADDSVVINNIQTSIDSRVTARRLYRTIADGGTRYLLTTIADNTTTTFTDTLADTMLVTQITEDQGIPPSGDVVVGRGNRLFMVDPNYPNRVRYCRASRPDNWPSTYYVEVETSDDEVVNLCNLDGMLYFIGRAGVYRLYGESPDAFQAVGTRSHVGTDCRWSVAVGPDGIYFARSDNGVYRFDGVKSVLVSESIRRTFGLTTETWVDIVDQGSISSVSRGQFLYGVYYLIVPMKASDGVVTNRLILYDSTRPGGAQTWLLCKSTCNDIFADKGRGKIYGCMVDLSDEDYYNVYELFSVDSNANDTAVPEFVTKAFTIVEPKRYTVQPEGFSPVGTVSIGWINSYRIDAVGSWDLDFYVDDRSVYSGSHSGLTSADRHEWHDLSTKLKGHYVYVHGTGTGTPGPSTHKIKEIEIR